MTHTTYAHVFITVLYTMGVIGFIVLMNMALRTISPLVHQYLDDKRTNIRAMDNTLAHYTNQKENSHG